MSTQYERRANPDVYLFISYEIKKLKYFLLFSRTMVNTFFGDQFGGNHLRVIVFLQLLRKKKDFVG